MEEEEEVEVPNYEPILYGSAAPATAAGPSKASASSGMGEKRSSSPKLPKLNEGMKKPLSRTSSNKPKVG